ncbi:MAG: hypothetical protein WCT27_02440 [Patescibacteria group bacterium]|jgi:hypothetical protein
MFRRNAIFTAIVLCLAFILSYSFAYSQSSSDQEKVDRLGKKIRDYQTSEVWPGGNEYSGAYTEYHRNIFLRKGGASAIVTQARNNQAVTEGAKTLANFDRPARLALYSKWLTPIYPTWEMIGEVSDKGTTNAGYETEKEIAAGLVALVKEIVTQNLQSDLGQNQAIDYQADFKRLGTMIRKYQTDVVWPGGNEYSGCYMDTDRNNFLARGGADRIVQLAKKNTDFVKFAKELKFISDAERANYCKKWSVPVYPTWAMNGEISDKGTTEAGYQTEQEIAKGLVGLVKEIVGTYVDPPSQPDKTIDFSGRQWGIKMPTIPFGPGPNHWSGSEDNIWVENNQLHLKIIHRDGKWTCPEVYLLQSLGFGTYTIEFASRVDNLDPQVVLGCFLYESLSRELDIEFSKVLANPNNAQFVVQPYTHSGNIVRYDIPAVGQFTCQIVWRPDHVLFSVWQGYSQSSDSLINSWTYTGADIPPANVEHFRFNLWLFGGKPPTTGHGDEVIVNSFTYQP